MNQESYAVKGLVAEVKHRASFRRIYFTSLLLLLFIAGAGPLTAAQAAPSAQQTQNLTTKYSLAVHPPQGSLCVGRQYPLTAVVQQVTVGTINGDDVRLEESLEGITVKATIGDTSIATISPDSAVTGEPELAGPGQVNPFEADFTLQALKAGTTTLVVETMIPRASKSSFGPALQITVVNCKYKVTSVSSWSFSAPNLFSHLAENSTGEMQLVSGSDNVLKGTSKVTWDMSSFSELCGHQQDIPPASAQLDGDVDDNGMLTVTITFAPFDMSTSNCASGSYGQFPVPAFKVTVPAEGGPQGGDHSFVVGKETLHGYTTVIVTPVEAK